MVQYNRGTGQSNDDAVSEQVITAVADARDVDPLDLPPLYNVIDPDALNQLFDQGIGGGGPGRVIFTMAGCEVVVHSDTEVEVTAPEEQASAPATTEAGSGQDEAEPTLE